MITNHAQGTQVLENIQLLLDHCPLFWKNLETPTPSTNLPPDIDAMLTYHIALLEVTDATLLEWVKEDALFQSLSDGLVDNLRYTYSLLTAYAQGEQGDLFASKVRFQLYPLLKTLYSCTYFLCFVQGDPLKEGQFTKEEQNKLFANPFQDQYLSTGNYPSPVSVFVLAYNQLDYTKQCVEAVLAQTKPPYQLILVNHGSTDGTKEYFDSIPDAIHLDLKNNDFLFSMKCLPFLYEGKYTCSISNDVVVGARYLENMITCMESDPTIYYVVPTTPNIAADQTIPYPDYGDDMEKMTVFSKKNNHSSPKRWEQKVRLCNPISLYRTQDIASSQDFLTPPLPFSFSGIGFGDDFFSHQVRQKGGKLILAKDAFCHHFGSVTLRHEANYLTANHIQEKRDIFRHYTGLDPYERGCHGYETLLSHLEKRHQGTVNLLAINSRLSTTALKIKETIRWENNVHGCTLHLLTEEPFYLSNMQSIGDEVTLYEGLEPLKQQFEQNLEAHRYQYILLEEKLVCPSQEPELVSYLMTKLVKNGSLFIKSPEPETIELWKHWDIFQALQEPERELFSFYRFKQRGNP